MSGKNTRTSRLRLLIAEARHLPTRDVFPLSDDRAREGSLCDGSSRLRDIFMYDCYRLGHISERIYAASLLKGDGSSRVRSLGRLLTGGKPT